MDKILMLIHSWLRRRSKATTDRDAPLERLPFWMEADLPTFHPREP